jgi:MFS family permease
LGAAIGSLISGLLSDQIGRKPTIILADIIMSVGALLMALSPTIQFLIVGRFIIGVIY